MKLDAALKALLEREPHQWIIYSKHSSLAFISEMIGPGACGNYYIAKELPLQVKLHSYRLMGSYGVSILVENRLKKAYRPRWVFDLTRLDSYIDSTNVEQYIHNTWPDSPFKGTIHDPLFASDWVIARFGMQFPLHHNGVFFALIQRIIMKIRKRSK